MQYLVIEDLRIQKGPKSFDKVFGNRESKNLNSEIFMANEKSGEGPVWAVKKKRFCISNDQEVDVKKITRESAS